MSVLSIGPKLTAAFFPEELLGGYFVHEQYSTRLYSIQVPLKKRQQQTPDRRIALLAPSVVSTKSSITDEALAFIRGCSKKYTKGPDAEDLAQEVVAELLEASSWNAVQAEGIKTQRRYIKTVVTRTFWRLRNRGGKARERTVEDAQTIDKRHVVQQDPETELDVRKIEKNDRESESMKFPLLIDFYVLRYSAKEIVTKYSGKYGINEHSVLQQICDAKKRLRGLFA